MLGALSGRWFEVFAPGGIIPAPYLDEQFNDYPFERTSNKMFGFLKNLLRKPAEAEGYPQGEPARAPMPSNGVATLKNSSVSTLRKSNGNGLQNGLQNGGRPQMSKNLDLPLQPIIDSLPLELQPKLKFTNVGDLTISIPLEQVISQLSRGAVRLSFGQLREAAPQVFSSEEDRDRTMVPLPLGDILSRLSPTFIARRRVQKQVELPDEISSPFGQAGQGLLFSVGTTKQEPEPPRAQVASAPHRPASLPSVAPAVPALPARPSITLAPTPPPPSATPVRPPAMISATRALRELNSAPAAVAPPATPHAPVAPQPSAPVAKPLPEVETLVVGLTALAETWPDQVRKEIVELNLVDIKVALPVDLLGQALRQGRIAFSWKTLRSWFRPALVPGASPHDNLVLELPLKVVAPLFLARQQEANQAKQKVAVSEDIPNLFFGFPQPESDGPLVPASLNHAVTKPVDTNFYVWEETSDTVRIHESEIKQPTSLGTKFVAKYATPNEVVSRAAALEGVSGALIALPDGLMVASQLSPDLNADTLAAFLPHIFGKVSQCTKELRMGELNNLNFTVGNVPWKIFRVNAIFFAAFGHAGQPLPTAQLAALANELDHKPK